MLCSNLTVILLTLSPLMGLQTQNSCILTISQEKPVLLLYYSSSCPFSQDVLDYLKKIHKRVPMKNVLNNPQAKEGLRNLGGPMMVPCLVIDGQPTYDSDQIIYWLSQHQDLLDPN